MPIQQATILLDKLKAAGVETRLETKPGAEHGWPKLSDDMKLVADWFDDHLLPAKAGAPNDGAVKPEGANRP